MTAYKIDFTFGKYNYSHSMLVDAKDVKSAKHKIEKRMGKPIKISNVSVIGYY